MPTPALVWSNPDLRSRRKSPCHVTLWRDPANTQVKL